MSSSRVRRFLKKHGFDLLIGFAFPPFHLFIMLVIDGFSALNPTVCIWPMFVLLPLWMVARMLYYIYQVADKEKREQIALTSISAKQY